VVGARTRRRKVFLIVILNEPAGDVKDLSFLKQRAFAAAQDDKPKSDFRYLVLGGFA
jgi:hypothetical protein